MEEPVSEISVRVQGIWSPVWRRIEMPLAATLKTLHDTIQAAFGWKD